MKQSSAVGAAGVIGTLSGQLLAQEGPGPEKPDLAKLTVEDFSALVGSEFRMEHESGRSAAVKLAEAYPIRSRGPGRQPFSLIFHAPRDVMLQQETYTLNSPRFGSIRLFLVPVERRTRHHCLQAVFA